MIAEELSIPKAIVNEMLTQKLDMKKLWSKILPKLLTSEQKVTRVDWCDDSLELEEKGVFRNRVITGS